MTRLQRLLIALGIILTVPACTTTKYLPGETVEVKVAVPVPCVPVEVEETPRPTATPDMSLFELVQVALADRAVLEGDNTRLQAANANPCPEVSE